MLAANIKKQRKMLGISQEKLAEAVSLSTQTINDIEGCRTWVSDKTLVKLSQAFKVEAYQLLIPNIEADIEHLVYSLPGTSPKYPPSSASEIVLELQQVLRKILVYK